MHWRTLGKDLLSFLNTISKQFKTINMMLKVKPTMYSFSMLIQEAMNPCHELVICTSHFTRKLGGYTMVFISPSTRNTHTSICIPVNYNLLNIWLVSGHDWRIEMVLMLLVKGLRSTESSSVFAPQCFYPDLCAHLVSWLIRFINKCWECLVTERTANKLRWGTCHLKKTQGNCRNSQIMNNNAFDQSLDHNLSSSTHI